MPTPRKLLYFDQNYGAPTETSSTDIGVLGQIQLNGVGGVAISAGNNLISNVATPVSPSDAATKAYADAIAQGISVINSCQALSNTNIASLSGTMTIDGVSLVAGNRVLLVGQTNQVQNGVWLVQSGSWVRPPKPDFSTGTNASGRFTFIEGGTTFSKEGWICNAQPGSDVIDTNNLTFTQFSGLGEVTAGSGLITSGTNGNAIAINLAANPGLQFTNGALDHLLRPTGAIAKDGTGLYVSLNTNNTLASDANGLRVLGLPNLFTVAGIAVDANVTAANLNALNDGNASLVDALHSHASVLSAQAVTSVHKNGATNLNAGDPVQWSSTADTLQRCDAAAINTAQCIGVAATAIAANATGTIIKRGIATGVLSQATPGTPIYLAVGGGLTASLNQAFAGSIVRAGIAKNATDLDVNCVYVGQRAAS